MKAMLCKELGHPSKMVLEDMPSPVPKENEVWLEVKACSVNFPDTLMVQGLYQFKPDLPFSPGSDVSGIVKAVGANIKHLKPGDNAFGIVSHGGFAEEVIVPGKGIFPKPDGMEHSIAASFMMAYGTSYYALKSRGKLAKDETLLVLGASGGVGLAAVELGKIMGATVIAAASTNQKLELCKQYGADHLINYTDEDLKTKTKELTGGKGADVVIDPVGGNYTEAALRATGWDGRFLIIGFPAGIAKIPMNLPLLKSCQIVGVFWGAYAMRYPAENMQNTMTLIQMYRDGKLKPHIQKTYALENAQQALTDMMDRKVMGKIVVVP